MVRMINGVMKIHTLRASGWKNKLGHNSSSVRILCANLSKLVGIFIILIKSCMINKVYFTELVLCSTSHFIIFKSFLIQTRSFAILKFSLPTKGKLVRRN